MMRRQQFQRNVSTQPIPAGTVKKETEQERFQRLKRTAEATGRRFIHVYLEEERKRKGNQR
jgi:hypothetical protein